MSNSDSPYQQKSNSLQKRVFISGVAGLIGSALANRMLELGYTVVGCDNLSGGDRANVPAGVLFYESDILDFSKNIEILKDVDIVFHAAAAAYDGLSVFCPSQIAHNIYSGTASIISAAIENKIGHFIYFSSMSRYGQNLTPFTEDQTPAPRTPYGVSKVASENLVKNLSELHGMKYSIVVPHNVIGPHQKSDDPFRNVVAIMLNRIFSSKPPIIYGDGFQRRCFSDVLDCVDCLVAIAESKESHGDIVNIGPDTEDITINELVQKLLAITESELQPIYMPKRPGEVQLAVCSSEKAKSKYGFKRKVSLDESLIRIASHLKVHCRREFNYHIDLEINGSIVPKTWSDKVM